MACDGENAPAGSENQPQRHFCGTANATPALNWEGHVNVSRSNDKPGIYERCLDESAHECAYCVLHIGESLLPFPQRERILGVEFGNS